jgi:3-hydroxyisobutyrate dehydrogenase
VDVGVVGLGSMGAPMARNLLAGGHRVVGYDIDPAALTALHGPGFMAADSVAAMAERCEIVLTMVWDDAALRDVVFGVDGVLAATGPSACLVDLSTTSLELALEVAAALASRAGTFLDAAVIGGGAAAARSATSPIVVSGDQAAYTRFGEVFAALGRCAYVGASGNAKIMKIVNNLLVGVITAANAEVLALGVAAGFALEDLVGWLVAGSATSTVLESYMGRFVREGIYGDGLIGHELMAKDMSLACRLADRARSPALLSEIARQLYFAGSDALGARAPFPSLYEYFFAYRIAGTSFMPGVATAQDSIGSASRN